MLRMRSVPGRTARGQSAAGAHPFSGLEPLPPAPLRLPFPPQGRWVIFNDEKVAASEHPPFDRGYLYLFKRR